jgi:hypothetical protein
MLILAWASLFTHIWQLGLSVVHCICGSLLRLLFGSLLILNCIKFEWLSCDAFIVGVDGLGLR